MLKRQRISLTDLNSSHYEVMSGGKYATPISARGLERHQADLCPCHGQSLPFFALCMSTELFQPEGTLASIGRPSASPTSPLSRPLWSRQARRADADLCDPK